MFSLSRIILVSAVGPCVLAAGLAGCGQKGALYMPTDPAAANRATLPQVIVPSASGKDPINATPSRNNNTATQPNSDSPP